MRHNSIYFSGGYDETRDSTVFTILTLIHTTFQMSKRDFSNHGHDHWVSPQCRPLRTGILSWSTQSNIY